MLQGGGSDILSSYLLRVLSCLTTCMGFAQLEIGEERKRRACTDGQAGSEFRVCCRYGDGLDELIKILLLIVLWT